MMAGQNVLPFKMNKGRHKNLQKTKNVQLEPGVYMHLTYLAVLFLNCLAWVHFLGQFSNDISLEFWLVNNDRTGVVLLCLQDILLKCALLVLPTHSLRLRTELCDVKSRILTFQKLRFQPHVQLQTVIWFWSRTFLLTEWPFGSGRCRTMHA